MTVVNSSTGERLAAWFKGSADRVVRTVVQVVAGYAALVLQQGGHEFNWSVIASVAGLAAAVSVATQFLALPSFGDLWIYQLAERAVKTFVQTVIAGVGAAVLFTDVDWDLTLHTALLAAVASLGTSVLTTRVGSNSGQVDLAAPPPGARRGSLRSAVGDA